MMDTEPAISTIVDVMNALLTGGEKSGGGNLVKIYYDDRGFGIQGYYQGGWKNGKRNGYGVFYWPSGTLRYEGEWDDDYVYGIEYDAETGLVEYVGGINGAGKYSGVGISFYDGHIWQEGNFCEGILSDDFAKCYHLSTGTLQYDGEYYGGYYDGQGKLYRPDGTLEYDGFWHHGVRDGPGKCYDKNGKISYNGRRKNGMKHGEGKLYKEGKICYDGEWKRGVRDGRGRGYWDEKLYDGDWKNDTRHGRGKVYKDGKLYYDGDWKNDLAYGKGRFYPNGELNYDGDWKNNVQHGRGKLYGNGRLVYEGEWKNNMFHGKGKLYDESGKVTRDGEWESNNLKRFITNGSL